MITERLNMDPSQVGVLFGCYAFGMLGITPIIGFLSDRYRNRKIPLIFAMAFLAASTALFAFGQTYWQLAFARTAQGVAGGISWTICLCMLADIYPSSELGGVMSKVLIGNSLGFLLGPPLGKSYIDIHLCLLL